MVWNVSYDGPMDAAGLDGWIDGLIDKYNDSKYGLKFQRSTACHMAANCACACCDGQQQLSEYIDA